MTVTVAGEGLLGSYVSYARHLTAAPLVYHLATGLAVISGCVGSSVSYMGAGDTEYWPNQYSLMLGPSGMHKTTAMNLGLELLRRASPEAIYSDQYSLESFILGLRDRPSRVLAVEEFATMLTDMDRSYMVGLKETLTKLYDPRQEFIRSTKSDGKVSIRRPSLTIIAASTPDWLVSHLKEVDFISGFMPRFLLWPSDRREPEPPGGVLAQADPQTRNALVIQLGRLVSLKDRPPGPNLTFQASAVRRIDTLRTEYAGRMDTEYVPRELGGLYNRCASYAAKIAALLCVADNGLLKTYEVDAGVADRACVLMGWLIDQAAMVFETQIVLQKFEREAQELLHLIPVEGVLWSTALKRSRRSARDFGAMVQTLKEREQVVEDSRESATKSGRILFRTGNVSERFAKDSGKDYRDEVGMRKIEKVLADSGNDSGKFPPDFDDLANGEGR